MASIHQYEYRGKYYYAKFIGDDGQVKIRTTKQTDKDKAMTLALEWERVAEQARRGLITEAQCRKVLGEMLERVTGETFRADTTEEFLERWLKSKENSKSTGTHTRYAGTMKLFLESIGRKGKLPLGSIIAKDIERFKKAQLDSGKAMSTTNTDLKTLRNVFNVARRQGLITVNPVETVELDGEERHERKGFTHEQMKALITTAEGEWKTAIMLGYFLGCRIGDAVTMTWKHVALDRKTITYTQKKTGTTLEVPMHPDLHAHLMSIAGDDPAAPLTPTLATQEVGGRNGLSRQFKDLMAKARVDDGRIEKAELTGDDAEERENRGRAFSTLSFHSLRVSFVSDLAGKGVAKELRMKLSGHQSDKVHDRYTKMQLEPLQKAIAELPSILTPS